jgi:Leucine-rich repeat (LRR) protein
MRLYLEREILLEIKKKMQLNINWDRNISLNHWNRIVCYPNRIYPSKFSVFGLTLYNFGLTYNIPTEIGELVNLQNLDLANNNLICKIPTEIGKLVNLTVLELDDNKLIGKIPTGIGKLINLISLSLDNNNLTSQIPTEIGKLVNLNFL